MTQKMRMRNGRKTLKNKKMRNDDHIHIGLTDLSNILDVAELIASIAQDCEYIKRITLDFERGSITIIEDTEYKSSINN